MQKTTEKESETQKVQADKKNLNPQKITTSGESSTSWSGLWSRYKNLWRVRRKTGNLKSTGIKFALLIGVFALLSTSFAGPILASFAGVFLIAYESYKGNIDPFISSHIGVVASLPSVILSISLFLTAPGLAESMTGSMIGLMYAVVYPLLYYVYSDIGVNLSEQNRGFD